MNSNCGCSKYSKLNKNVSRKLFARETKKSDMLEIVLKKYCCSALHARFIHRSVPPENNTVTQIRKIIH